MTATTMKSRPFAFGAMLLLLFQPSSSSASGVAAVASNGDGSTGGGKSGKRKQPYVLFNFTFNCDDVNDEDGGASGERAHSNGGESATPSNNLMLGSKAGKGAKFGKGAKCKTNKSKSSSADTTQNKSSSIEVADAVDNDVVPASPSSVEAEMIADAVQTTSPRVNAEIEVASPFATLVVPATSPPVIAEIEYVVQESSPPVAESYVSVTVSGGIVTETSTGGENEET